MTNDKILVALVNNEASKLNNVAEIEDWNNPQDGITIWLTNNEGINYRRNQDDYIFSRRVDSDGEPLF